jgi:peroxiredoxin
MGLIVGMLLLPVLLGAHERNRLCTLVLPDVHGKTVALTETQNALATVYILLAPECPICIQSTPALNKLAEQYGHKNIRFYGMFAGTLYTQQELSKFAQRYPTTFPLLMDTAYVATDILQGNVTPQAFVTNAAGKVIYKGAIDNAWVALGRRSKHITRHYVAETLDALLNKQPVPESSTRAIGCLLERPKRMK